MSAECTTLYSSLQHILCFRPKGSATAKNAYVVFWGMFNALLFNIKNVINNAVCWNLGIAKKIKARSITSSWALGGSHETPKSRSSNAHRDHNSFCLPHHALEQHRAGWRLGSGVGRRRLLVLSSRFLLAPAKLALSSCSRKIKTEYF